MNVKIDSSSTHIIFSFIAWPFITLLTNVFANTLGLLSVQLFPDRYKKLQTY